MCARLLSRYSNWLRGGQSGDRILVGARFFTPVQISPGSHPASCTMGTGSFPGVKSGRGVTLAPHPFLVPWSWKSSAIPLLPLWAVWPVQSLSRAIPLLPLWAVWPVQSLSVCTRVHFTFQLPTGWAKFRSQYRDWLRAGRSGDRNPVGARFSAPVQNGPEAHPASYTMGTGSFPRVKSSQGMTLTPHPLLVPWSWKSSAIGPLPLWAVRPVQSPSACTRVHFTYFLCTSIPWLRTFVCSILSTLR
jgi:hypothetical protein